MATNPAPLGSPCLLDTAGGAIKYTPLNRSAMDGATMRYKELELQTLIANNPAVLPLKDFLPTTTSVVSLGREIAVDIGGQAGYIDNLLITNEGWLVLVETKLQRNSESTREVIAQILQYGMAISALSLRDLQQSLKLTGMQSIHDFVTSDPATSALIDDFEDVVERRLRRGELLYLIVMDEVRVSVERLTHWMNERGSAPFKFGLVELRFFDAGAESMLVVPRTLVKTREISRHVVVVDIQGPGAVDAFTKINQDGTEATVPEQRVVKAVMPPMTTGRLLAGIAANKGNDESAMADRTLQFLEEIDLERRPTPSTLQYGVTFPLEDGTFYPLLTFTTNGAWSHPSSAAVAILGDQEFVAHKLRMNQVAPFYRPEQAADATKRSNELVVSYGKLDGRAGQLADAVITTKHALVQRLSG